MITNPTEPELQTSQSELPEEGRGILREGITAGQEAPVAPTAQGTIMPPPESKPEVTTPTAAQAVAPPLVLVEAPGEYSESQIKEVEEAVKHGRISQLESMLGQQPT